MRKELEIIISSARNGDKKAMGLLVQQYQQYAFNLAFRLVCNEDDARDVVQDSFIKMWRNMKQFNPEIKFTTWMYKIVTNTAIDLLRSTKKMNLVSIDDFQEKFVSASADNPEIQLNNKETGQMIRSISNTLSEKQKLVFVLKDLQGLSSSEVGDVLDLSTNSIKSNLYHARKVIKEKMQKILSYEGRVL